MSAESFPIDIPNTQAGRIHVGLSWNDIYDETTAKALTQRDISNAKVSTFPKVRVLIIFLIFTLLSQAIAAQLIYLVRVTAELFSTDSTQSIIENIEPSWMSFIIVLILSTTLFIYMLYKAINQKGFFLILGEKHHDDDQRDKNHMNFDLDLHCYVYDKDKKFLFSIDPQSKKLIPPDESETAIYHSGEETDGSGVFDDETIHIETKKLNDDYHHFIFAVSNDCAHEFNKINELKVRLANSQTDETIIEDAINSNESDGYVFCSIHKNGDQWVYKKIGKYIPFDDNWKTKLEEFLD